MSPIADDSHIKKQRSVASLQTLSAICSCLLIVGAVAALGNIVGDLATKLAAPDKSHETTRHPQTRYCSTVDCQKLAWLFHKAIDTQKNPCDNFYHYVCGKVLRQYGSRKYSTVSDMGDNLTFAFHRSLSEATPPRKNQSAFDKAASFYQICLQRPDASNRNREVIKKFLKANNLQFNGEGTFDPVHAVYRLLFVENINFLLRVQLDRSLFDNHYMLSLSSSSEFKMWIETRESLIDSKNKYNNYVIDVLAVIGLTEKPALSDTITQIKALENTVVKLKYANISMEKDYVLPVSELSSWFQMDHNKSRVMSENLLAPGDYNIRGPIRDFHFLRSLLVNISPNDLRTYTTWEVLRLLSNVSGLVNIQETQSSLEWYCYTETRKFYSHAVALHIFFPLVNKSRLANIDTMADNIIERLDDTIRKSEWLQGLSLRKTLGKLHRINRQLGYPSGLDTAEGMEDYYRPFPDVTGPYLEAYLKSAAAAMRHLINFVEQPTADPRNIEFETRKVNAYYYHSGEFASFPAAILMPPAFNYGAPPEINYGSLGRIIVHELMHALDRSWTASLRARSRSFFHTVDMEQAYLSKSQCLLKSATRPPEGARVPESWTPELLADHMGQSALIEAYRRASAESAVTIRSLGQFTSEQLFFISFCLFLCSNYKSGALGSHPPSVDRCNVPLKHSPEFAKAFSCPSGSPMNPTNKCSFW